MPGPLALVEVVGWRSVEGPIRARSGEPQKTPLLLSMTVVLHKDSHIGITKGSSIITYITQTTRRFFTQVRR